MLWLSLLVLLDCFFSMDCRSGTLLSGDHVFRTSYKFHLCTSKMFVDVLGCRQPEPFFFFSKKNVSEHLVTTEEHAIFKLFSRSVCPKPAR